MLLGMAGRSHWSLSAIADRITRAYASGALTPSDVVERALGLARALAAQTPTMGPLYKYADVDAREEAAESTARYRAGKPKGPLDGVPCAIKEEMAIRGFPWSFGTHLYDEEISTKDATVVARLRASGAIILGMTAMTEFGMTPTGINPKRPMPRNPHAPDCLPGGSSTGTAVAVATGLVPFGMGADGGGSIRTPAALCGVFGIKPTWGRISRESASGGSVAHLGPLASSVIDLARVLEVTAGPDPGDDETHGPGSECQKQRPENQSHGESPVPSPRWIADGDHELIRVVIFPDRRRRVSPWPSSVTRITP
jgi:aspartyl-tRNA(Asn)/glutamyl-tRNA(Gln) amidotransferase subunit A